MKKSKKQEDPNQEKDHFVVNTGDSENRKGQFFYWTRDGNGTGLVTLVQALETYYTNLAAAYLLKGMEFESGLFASGAEEFKKIEQNMKNSLNEYPI
jgi:hypothetical protein